MSFWSDLGNFITGRNKIEIAQAEISAQQQFAEEALKQQIIENELKYSPEAIRERTKQITIVIVSITIIIGLFLYFKSS